MMNELEQELIAGGADAAETRELAKLAGSLPEMRQLPLLQTPRSLQGGHGMLRRRAFFERWRFAGALGGAMAAAVIATTWVTAAAQSAVPGDSLYSVKRMEEAVAVQLAPGYHDQIMMHRADEVSRLVERGSSPKLITATLASYDQAVATDPASSYGARDYCAGMLKAAAAHADPQLRVQIMQSLSHLQLDNT